MEPGYVLAVCIGCFSPLALDAPYVSDSPAIRILAPESYATRCFGDPGLMPEVPRKIEYQEASVVR